jgi:hypothetical protein
VESQSFPAVQSPCTLKKVAGGLCLLQKMPLHAGRYHSPDLEDVVSRQGRKDEAGEDQNDDDFMPLIMLRPLKHGPASPADFCCWHSKTCWKEQLLKKKPQPGLDGARKKQSSQTSLLLLRFI